MYEPRKKNIVLCNSMTCENRKEVDIINIYRHSRSRELFILVGDAFVSAVDYFDHFGHLERYLPDEMVFVTSFDYENEYRKAENFVFADLGY